MRLLFITSSFESGKDGVGDYTRLLALEAKSAGHTCAVLALCDKFTLSSISTVVEQISILRLSSRLDKVQRINQSKNLIQQFQPDHISLQVVSYGYNKFGFVAELISMLSRILTTEVKLHINFHELWIGAEQGHSLKPYLIGQVQKFFLLKLVKKFKPVFVTATTEVFCFMLAENNVKALLLPSFSNIRKTIERAETRFYNQDLLRFDRLNSIWFVFFGSINPDWDFRPLFKYLLDQQKRTGMKFIIFSVGNQGKGASTWEQMKDNFSEQQIFIKLGERNEEEISSLLQQCDFGLTGYPELVYKKSGAIAAMIDHGLKVIISNDTVKQPKFVLTIDNPSILRLQDIQTQDIRQLQSKVDIAESLLSEVSRKFLTNFNQV